MHLLSSFAINHTVNYNTIPMQISKEKRNQRRKGNESNLVKNRSLKVRIEKW